MRIRTHPAAWISDRRALIDAATEGPWWTTRDMSPADVFAGYGSADDVALALDIERPADAALIADSRTSLPKALDALEAVLGLHTPERFEDHPEKEFCRCCQRTAGVYPCRTVTAITAALGIEVQS